MKQLADFATRRLVANGVIAETDAPIYAYGFEAMFSTLFTFGSIFALAAFMGSFLETIIFLAGFFPLRIYAGGYHASTRARCYLMSLSMIAIFVVLLAIIPSQWYLPLDVLIALIAMLCVILWAPVIHKNRRVTSEEVRRYRRISLLICGIDILVLIAGQSILPANDLLFAFGLGIFSAVITMPIAKLAT